MKINVNEHGNIVLKEVFSGVLMQTKEGNQIGICMRDDSFEINVIPKGTQLLKSEDRNWWRVNMQDGTIIKDVAKPSVPSETACCDSQPLSTKQGN
ncbi:MAG: hypothetical protein GY861_28075 [bacterium]|nr:hypothetical protein [bacterium]